MSEAGQAHDPLPAYVAGTLDAAAAASFREHLSSCLTCRRDLELLEQLRTGAERHGSEFFADHPDVERIVAYATARDPSMAGPDVDRHLEFCAACSAEVSWVRGESEPVATPASASAPRRVSRSAMWGWATAAAASIALAVVTLRPGPTAVPEDGPTAFGIVQPVERRTQQPNAIVIQPDAVSVTLAVVVDLPPSVYPTSVELLDATGRVVVRDTVASPGALADGLYHALTCPVERCPPGGYDVRIAAGTAEEHSIPLRLVRAAGAD